MDTFVKIGPDLINLAAISRVTFVENQSGISDRILIQVGEVEVVVDSAIGGKPRMDAIRVKLMQNLAPSDWDSSYGSDAPEALPAFDVQAA
ncbi:MAG TPA: hypothetical protein VFE47_05625 [Tepidisphaeraceae bacterium]|jgi:hypothetical protein|nr:hypothetical protein [Tepidisphaeraceae bacterium]